MTEGIIAPTETAGNGAVLIDLSSLAYPIWHMSGSNPDPNAASIAIVDRVRSMALGYAEVAICCDSGRSFRKDVAESYKANREAAESTLVHQIRLAQEQLEADGFPVWSVKGFEADDLIASAVAKLSPFKPVLVVTADKDLLQLVGPNVRVKSASNGTVMDAEAVKAKFGVWPGQMRDYLTLVGDKSDNVVGAKGIGPKNAADLLSKFDSLDELYQELKSVGAASVGVKPSIAKSLTDYEPIMETTRTLITLRTDVELPMEQLSVPRVPKDAETFDAGDDQGDDPAGVDSDVAPEAPNAGGAILTDPATPLAVRDVGAVTVREADDIQPSQVALVPAEWERQLDPRSMGDARKLALDMHQSRMFSAYGSPQAVLSTVMVGRELGLPAMASLRSIHNVEGKHTLSAALMVALVLKSGMAEYFEPIEFDDKKATFETKRKGARNPVRLTHTIEMAETAGLIKDKSNWKKVPTDMLMARAQSRLCRLVYPDLMAGLYTPEELIEARQEVA